jgi:hypothetical protein
VNTEPNRGMRTRALRRPLRRVALGALALFLLIQLVPYGWRHPSPPVTQDAPWPGPRVPPSPVSRAAPVDAPAVLDEQRGNGGDD